jgi:DNA invertase Pin-like site-specific DNA recombinase
MIRLHIGGEDEQAGCDLRPRSTDKQTIEAQLRELRQIAKQRGWEVAHEYHDAGISGSKGREARPGLDEMLNDAERRRFDVVMAWAIDRLGRSLIDLLGTIQTLGACGVDLYLDQQSIDTTTPAGRLMFQITGAFAEFERSMIRQRVRAGLKRAVESGKQRHGEAYTSSIASQKGYAGHSEESKSWYWHRSTYQARDGRGSPFRRRRVKQR